MRSMPVHLLGILALAAAFALVIGGWNSFLLVMGGGALTLAALIVLAQAAPKPGTATASAPGPAAWPPTPIDEPVVIVPAAGDPTPIPLSLPGSGPAPKPIDEVEAQRVLRLGTYGATLLIAGVVVGLSAFSGSAAFVLLLVAIAWVIAWWPARTRTYSLTTAMEIRCDPATVFAFVSDVRNVPRYYYMYEQRVEKIGDAPIGAGTEFRCHLVFRARQLPNVKQDEYFDAIDQIIEFQPNTHLTIKTMALAPNLGTYTIEPIPGGTRMTYRYEHLHSYASCFLGSTLLRGASADRYLRSSRQAAWARLKEILEGRQPATP